jgi:hypothetical protein
MACFIVSSVLFSIRRATVSTYLIFCAVLAVSAASALAQRTTGGAAHISPAPVYHPRPSSAAVFHAPITTPRNSSIRSAGAIGSFRFSSTRRPIRPLPPAFLLYWSPFIFGGPFSGFNCWFADCGLLWPGMFDFGTVSSPGQVYISPASAAPTGGYDEYRDYGEEDPDMPQLYLKDGSILNVSDYWLLDGQLHFTMIEAYGANPTEEVIPFEALDLQKSVDVNTRRGFRFMLRNEPFEQYAHDHPEGPPPALTPSHP